MNYSSTFKRRWKRVFRPSTSAALVCLFTGSSALAQINLTYQRPPQSIVDLVEAPTTPAVNFNKDASFAILLDRPDYPSIEDVSQPILGLAGLRLNPNNNASAVDQYSTNISIKNLKTGVSHSIQGLPGDARIGSTSLNADETLLAFTNRTATGVELWVADLQSLQARRLTDRYLNEAYGVAFRWVPGDNQLLVSLIPANRGLAPTPNPVPQGPVVQENLGKSAPSRTYQNLLQNPHDEALFDYYVTSQLAYVGLDGKLDYLGEPGIYKSLSFSPDGKYLLVGQVQRPYSYLVQVGSFPSSIAIWDRKGQVVKHLFDYPLDEAASLVRDAVSPHPRSYSWRPDQPATLTWVHALDGGKPTENVQFRDALYELAAPFTGESNQLLQSEWRFAGVSYSGTNYAFISERWRSTRDERTLLYDLNKKAVLRTVSQRKTDDAYSDPGRFVQVTNDYDRSIVLSEARGKRFNVFTIGNGASAEGDRPFLLKWDLLSGKKDTLFKSHAPYYELPVFFNNRGFVIISKEAINEAPNFFHVHLRNRAASQITDFEHPYPSLEKVHKEQIAYTRSDGLNLTGTLYLPDGFEAGKSEALPLLLWAYPREYESREAASQVKGSPYRFTRISWGSPVYWVTRGYAVLDNADMPIVGGDGLEPNDKFVEQLEMNARAAIDHLAGKSLIDRNRVAVGGHSYGAFMTANLLAHTDLFAAGLARSGAYNRTFTPFGFQNERRTYWEAPEVYFNMSPFSYAHKIKTPILLIHGMDDENSGTFPIQSERLYNAIKGHGGTARLVMMPKEFHGYRAKESILHTLWEMDRWLEIYVKNKK